jgi:hypothetical protein
VTPTPCHIAIAVASPYLVHCFTLSLAVNLAHCLCRSHFLSPPPGHSAGGAVGAYMAMILEVSTLLFVMFIEINLIDERLFRVLRV